MQQPTLTRTLLKVDKQRPSPYNFKSALFLYYEITANIDQTISDLLSQLCERHNMGFPRHQTHV